MKTVLVAEDDVMTQLILTTMLKNSGYGYVIVNDGQACIDALLGGLRPDLLLLDVEMPGMNGIEVLEELTKHGLIEAFPIVVLSSHSDSDVVMTALKHGAHDYIVKHHVADLPKRLSDLVFEIDGPGLKAILVNLRMPDPAAFRSPGLQNWDEDAFNAYLTNHGGKSICVLVAQGQYPQALSKAALVEIATKVHIFRKCAYGWRKVWPTWAKPGKAKR